MFGNIAGKPGVVSTFNSQPREIFFSGRELAQFMSPPVTVDGTLSSNPANGIYPWLLWAGQMFGRVTATKKYANSTLGQTQSPLGGGQTTLSCTVATATEIVRRIGTSGTLNITGPNVPSGTVTTGALTYSAVNLTTGALTISADAAAAVSAVNQINTLITVDSTGSGTFTITVEGITTAAITYSATVATLISNINAQLNAAFGTSAIVASGASLAALVLTFSGTGFAARPVGTVTTTPLAGATGFTISGNGAVGVSTASPVSTAGVTAAAAQGGEFIAGSLIQPNDGSQNILTLLAEPDGLQVVDALHVTRLDTFCSRFLARGGGVINTGLIVDYPTDPSLQYYIKEALRRYTGAGFLDDITG